MLLMELAREKVPTFVGLEFDEESRLEIMKLSKGLQNRTRIDSLHVTLLYSKKPITMEARGKLETPIKAKGKQYSLFTTEQGANCLVLELDSDDIVKRHKSLMTSTGASYDFPEYHPHVTLSYNVGDNFDLTALPPAPDVPELTIIEEYSEKLNLNWAKKAVNA